MIDQRKYVVLDVETNGLSSIRDDLLSLSIYSPTEDKYFDKFFPLEKQTTILTTSFNGITNETLKNAEHLTQKEFDEIVSKFRLKNRIILTYSDLDKRFIKEYLKRHHISGFDELNFYNFKDNIISSAYKNGLLTKDNLCRAFNINGVKDVHSSHNDCKLEWELFKFLDNRKLFVSYSNDFCPTNVKHNKENWYIYEFSDQYIVPVSFLHAHPKFKKILYLPNIEIEYEKVFEYEFSKKCSSIYCRQPAGIASEHLIKTLLKAKYQNNINFLAENKRKLKYLGSIIAPREERVVSYVENSDGTLRAVFKEDEEIIKAINNQTNQIKKEIVPVVDFIKRKIFKEKDIMSQELVVNDKYRMLGLCDFSNEFGVLETKWLIYKDNKRYIDEYKYQLYITSNRRPIYIMLGSGNKITINRVSFKENN